MKSQRYILLKILHTCLWLCLVKRIQAVVVFVVKYANCAMQHIFIA